MKPRGCIKLVNLTGKEVRLLASLSFIIRSIRLSALDRSYSSITAAFVFSHFAGGAKLFSEVTSFQNSVIANLKSSLNPLVILRD